MTEIIEFEQIMTSAIVLFALCGAVSAVDSAWSFIKAWSKPARDIAHQVEHHAECLDRDNERIGELEESSRLIMRGIMQLMSHEIDGNHVDKLRDARDAMEQYLISK